MTDRERAVAELHRLIEGIPVAMVTTIAADEMLRARPMLLECLEPDGTLVFLTHLSSQKTAEVRRNSRVNVAFQSDKGTAYVSVSGTATVAQDVERMRTLWNPTYRAWFPGGADDPDGAIFTVHIDRVEYWDVPSSRLMRLWGVVRGRIGVRPGSDQGQTRVRPGSDGFRVGTRFHRESAKAASPGQNHPRAEP